MPTEHTHTQTHFHFMLHWTFSIPRFAEKTRHFYRLNEYVSMKIWLFTVYKTHTMKWKIIYTIETYKVNIRIFFSYFMMTIKISKLNVYTRIFGLFEQSWHQLIIKFFLFGGVVLRFMLCFLGLPKW
jgi:hypothetical protein